MDFSFTPEQEELRRTVRDLVSKRVGSADVRRAMDAGGFDRELWKVACEQLGLPALAIPEEYGGVGASLVEAGIAVEELGAALAPVPLLATVAAASAVGGDRDLLSGLADGSRVGALGVGDVTGRVDHVLDGPHADVFVVAADDGLWVVDADAPGLRRTDLVTLDLTRRQCALDLGGVSARRIGDAAASQRARDICRVLLAVEAVGGSRRCLSMTVDYLKTRVQFGRPIGSFQALKHRCADLAVLVEGAASTAYYALWAAAASPSELAVVAPLALAYCGSAYLCIARETIQLHGGIGITWEHDAHLYLKRATTTALVFGDAVAQRRLVATRAGLAP